MIATYRDTMKKHWLTYKGPFIRFLRAGVVLGIMAMLLQANYCIEQMPGDDVAESIGAQEDGSTDGSEVITDGPEVTTSLPPDGPTDLPLDGTTIDKLGLDEACVDDSDCISDNCQTGICVEDTQAAQIMMLMGNFLLNL